MTKKSDDQSKKAQTRGSEIGLRGPERLTANVSTHFLGFLNAATVPKGSLLRAQRRHGRQRQSENENVRSERLCYEKEMPAGIDRRSQRKHGDAGSPLNIDGGMSELMKCAAVSALLTARNGARGRQKTSVFTVLRHSAEMARNLLSLREPPLPAFLNQIPPCGVTLSEQPKTAGGRGCVAYCSISE